jgi:DNA-binding MarR family transcriptional regulator
MSTAPSTTPAFSPQVLGQTEKALNAILARELAGTGLSETQWVTLAMTVTGGGTADADELVARLAGVLKVGDAEARARITELASAQLLHVPGDAAAPVTVTDAGQQLHARIRAAVTEITRRMWGDLPAEDLATAARVLSTVLARADAELAAA